MSQWWFIRQFPSGFDGNGDFEDADPRDGVEHFDDPAMRHFAIVVDEEGPMGVGLAGGHFPVHGAGLGR